MMSLGAAGVYSIDSIGGAAVWPLRAHSQKQPARIGVLIDVAENNPAAKRWVVRDAARPSRIAGESTHRATLE